MIRRQSGLNSLNAAACAAALMLLAPQAHGYKIGWVPVDAQTDRIAVEVGDMGSTDLAKLRSAGWTRERWQELLSVSVDVDDVASQLFLPPVHGTYRVVEKGLRFEPQFPLQRGVRYRAVFRPQHLPKSKATLTISSTFALPVMPKAATTIVTGIFPTADVLPENLLKFYVHFSAPMSRGEIYDYIELREAAGKAVEVPFLQIDEELWDAEMKRLTLFIDPGRIKRGVLPLEEVGPALEAGKRYELTIRSPWRDALGSPLKEDYTKRFTVGQPDRDPPDPARWELVIPRAGSREPLAINFTDAMDHALALRLISVYDNERAVAGERRLRNEERQWLFTPSSAWRRGNHVLAIQSHIEDLAGNNVGKPFEVDLFEGVQRRLTNTTVKLPFSIR